MRSTDIEIWAWSIVGSIAAIAIVLAVIANVALP
jgi:hypothetical protein